MCDNELKLIESTEDLFGTWREFVADYHAAGEEAMPGSGSISADCSTPGELAAAAALALQHTKGIDLQDGWVPYNTYWFVREGRILGTCSVRHHLNESLRTFGGHIGYTVRPSERQKGYGKVQLRLALDRARDLGIDRVQRTSRLSWIVPLNGKMVFFL